MGSDAAYAVGRFDPDGVKGYRAATMPNAPLRATRTEAVADEREWLDNRHRIYVTSGASRQGIADAVREYRGFRDDPEAWGMLAGAVAQVRAELRNRRRINRAIGDDPRAGWMDHAAYVAMWARHRARAAA